MSSCQVTCLSIVANHSSSKQLSFQNTILRVERFKVSHSVLKEAALLSGGLQQRILLYILPEQPVAEVCVVLCFY